MFPLDIISGRDRGDGLHGQPPITRKNLTQACVLEETLQRRLTAKAKHRKQQDYSDGCYGRGTVHRQEGTKVTSSPLQGYLQNGHEGDEHGHREVGRCH